jgi:hypothetical protein
LKKRKQKGRREAQAEETKKVANQVYPAKDTRVAKLPRAELARSASRKLEDARGVNYEDTVFLVHFTKNKTESSYKIIRLIFVLLPQIFICSFFIYFC